MKKSNVLFFLLLSCIIAACFWFGSFLSGLIAGICLCILILSIVGLLMENKTRRRMAIIKKLKAAIDETIEN